MKLQMVDLVGQYNHIKEEIDASIQEVINSAAFINGPAVKEFAIKLAKYNGCNHAIPCANGTDALQIAMMTLGLKPGDEVIIPVHTYVATAEVIALLGLKPIFVDVDKDLFTIDVNNLEDKITSKTKAVVPVHLI
jgi:dTDP-4-amino-4,6-dideoxygalactose transaminase